jgi:hypothetical protein
VGSAPSFWVSGKPIENIPGCIVSWMGVQDVGKILFMDKWFIGYPVS